MPRGGWLRRTLTSAHRIPPQHELRASTIEGGGRYDNRVITNGTGDPAPIVEELCPWSRIGGQAPKR
jgi:hypothetical protein